MTEQSKKVSILRKVFVTAALVVLLGLFFTLYYFVYIPQQQTAYEKSSFRILKEMAENFKDRVQGIDTADMKSPGVLSSTKIPDDSNTTRSALIDAIKIPEEKSLKLSGNSLSNVLSKKITDSVKRTVSKLMTQIVGLHATNFESVILIRTDSAKVNPFHSGTIIYSSSNLALDDAVNMDSIYKKNSFFIYPATFDLESESLKYKLFILPFKLDDQRFVIGGFISDRNYKINSRSFPVLPLVILAVLLIVILASLPFLKVFLLSPQENISVRDVRSIIAMIYITPFIFIVLVACAWLYSRAEDATKNAISDLHTQVAETFYNEINDALVQLKKYNSLLQSPTLTSEIQDATAIGTPGQRTKIDLKEAALHPKRYKNFDGVFWIDSAGQEVAKWNFSKDSVYFFDKKDRQYVKDLQRHEGYVLPEGYVSDTFSIQPTLAKSTGDYTVSIVTSAQQGFGNKRSIMIGISGKPYSVFNPVVPKGLNFCIIDQAGRTLFHSESGRNLQENIFEEARDPVPLKLAVNRKDSTLLGIKLYEKDVNLLVSPLKGVPYYLITYAYKRNQVLHVFHILGFTLLTQSLLLLIIALIALFFYYSNAKFSQLFFVENDMEFAKPSEQKKEYYKHLFAFHSIIVLFSIITSMFFTGQKWLVFVLNLSIQLPIFSIMGYYIIRCLENNCVLISEAKREGNRALTTLKNLWTNPLFRRSILKVLIPYFIIILFFQIYKDSLLNTPRTTETALVDALIILLEILVPVLAICLKIFGLPVLKKAKKQETPLSESSFLHYFISALLLSAIVTTMIPVIGLLLYAGNQEKLLQLKSSQMYEAKKIQDKRVFVNERVAKTKLFTIPAYYSQDSLFVDSLKYSKAKGIYTDHDFISKEQQWKLPKDTSFVDYGLYKTLTQFLFLPPDHSDFFNNRKDYYYWQVDSKKPDSILWNFHYRNTDDYKDKAHLVISSLYGHPPNTWSLFKSTDSFLLLFVVLLFIYLFYHMLYSVSTRIFLIGYFERSPGKEQDEHYLNEKYFSNKLITDPFELDFWGSQHINTTLILQKEEAYENINQRDESILKIQTLLSDVYEKIWSDLTPSEQFTIFDISIDGFTNYRNIDIIYSLYKKGLLRKQNHHLVILNKSFRNFLVSKSGTVEIKKLKEEISEGGNWGNIRTVILVITLIVVVFLFVVQEDISKRVLAVATSLGALIPLMLKVFSKSSEGSAAASDKK